MGRSGSDIGDRADAAVRQVREALAKVDLPGIANAVSRAVGDAAHALGFGRREPSPYVICERDVDKRVQGQYVHCGILLFVALVFLRGAVTSDGDLVELGACLVLAGLHAWWGVRHLLRGQHERRLADVLAHMSAGLGRRERITLVELAEMVEVPTTELGPLVAEAIERGLIPEGHVDAPLGTGTLYLTASAWEADRALAEARQTHARKEAARARDVAPGLGSKGTLPADAVEVIQACRSFSAEALEARMAISDEDVAASLDGIASKVERLGEYVGRHPETAPQLRKLVTYYLPTTAKLASAYAELEGAGESPQVASTREELRETLALVDQALDRLSGELLRDQSWDLRSDMDVMRQQLEQDGLSDGNGGRGSRGGGPTPRP